MRNLVTRFIAEDAGATAIEYGLIAAIIGIGIIASLTQLQQALSLVFQNAADDLTAPLN